MIGCLRTRVPKQPIIALYFESETVLEFYNLEAWTNRSYLSIVNYQKKANKMSLIRSGTILFVHAVCASNLILALNVKCLKSFKIHFYGF